MRLIADTSHNHGVIKRLMIFEDRSDVYLFGYDRTVDGAALWDQWYESVADAKAAAQNDYQVPDEAWATIADPMEHCQHDWIQPVRVGGRAAGQLEWGKFEKLINGQWTAFNP